VYIKLEKLKFAHKLNHFALKAKIYLAASKAAWNEMCKIKHKVLNTRLMRNMRAINSINRVFEVAKKRIEEDKIDEEIVQMLALLPFTTRWYFLLTNRNFILRYFRRIREKYDSEFLNRVKTESNNLEHITEERIINAYSANGFSPKYSEVIKLIVQTGSFKRYLEAAPTIIVRCDLW
jgi:hypothetical protein